MEPKYDSAGLEMGAEYADETGDSTAAWVAAVCTVAVQEQVRVCVAQEVECPRHNRHQKTHAAGGAK